MCISVVSSFGILIDKLKDVENRTQAIVFGTQHMKI